MNYNTFIKLARHTISLIIDIIELNDKECSIDIDLQENTLILNTNCGVFVINIQTTAYEIWLSSPLSGPYHFRYNKKGEWESKTSYNLFNILSEELKINFNVI